MRPGLATILVLLAAIAGGIWLRTQQIFDQIVMDDEWHGLAAVRDENAAQIFSSFGEADRCIPLTLLHEFCSETIGLSEPVIRVPVVAASIVTLLLLPSLARRLLGGHGAAVYMLLLAGSPLMVYFGRLSRSYAFTPLLTGLALAALLRWRTDRRKRWAIGFVVAGALTCWFHQLAAPVVFSCLLGVLLARGPGSRKPPFGAVVMLGAMAAVAMAALLAAPLLLDRESLRARVGSEPTNWRTFDLALTLFSGSPLQPVRWLWVSAAIAGVFLLYRRTGALGAALVASGVIAAAAIASSGANGISHGFVYARYALPLLPGALLLVAIGLVQAETWLVGRIPEIPRGLLPLAAAVGLLVAGPVPWMLVTPNQFANHGVFHYQPLAWCNSTAPATLQRIPAVYQRLALEPPESWTIAEAPFHYAWHRSPYALYQLVHRQRVVMGLANDMNVGYEPAYVQGDPRVRWRHFAYLTDLQGLRARGVRYILVHVDLAHEQTSVPLQLETVDTTPILEFLRSRLGPPIHDDGWVQTFDLAPPVGPASTR